MLLKNENINVNIQDNNGNTALILASQNAHKEIIQMLQVPKLT